MIPVHDQLTHDALAELASLCDGFFDDLSWTASCQVVSPDMIPEPARSLLVHNDHMTATLGRHYAEPVALTVLDHRHSGDDYRRKIILTVGDGRTVEVGVVRLNLKYVSQDVRAAIVERRTPLGDILGKHGVLTRVEAKWFLRFPPTTPVVECFTPRPTGDVYGRLGLIYCDGEPAVELLEIVPS